MTRLILIEGLPGVGKTATVEALRGSEIANIATAVEFYNEHDNPLNSFWTWGDGAIEGEAVEEPFESAKFIDRILEKTRTLVARIHSEDLCVVMEGYPFHLPVGNMLKMLGTEEDCRFYLRRFVDTIGSCSPCLVFLEHPNWVDRISEVAAERGERFKQIFFDAFKRSPYARKLGINKNHEVLEFHANCQRFTNSLMNDWPFDPVLFTGELSETAVLGCLSSVV